MAQAHQHSGDTFLFQKFSITGSRIASQIDPLGDLICLQLARRLLLRHELSEESCDFIQLLLFQLDFDFEFCFFGLLHDI